MTTQAWPGLDVTAEVVRAAGVCDRNIAVDVRGAVVALTGHAPNARDREAAAHAVCEVIGVRAVVDDVDAGPTADVADGEEDVRIAEAVLLTLDWDLWVPAGDVKVLVRQGWVTLQGVVESRHQRDAALHDAARVPGVRGVTDAVSVRATPAVSQIRSRITTALRRRAEREAREIRIETFPGTVVLRGTVASRAERRAAERAAWTAPGISRVRSHLEVCDPDPGGG